MTEAMAETLTEPALFELLSLECRVGTDGTVHYFNALGQRHRVYGPAIEYASGQREWYQNGSLHRLDGPAIECPNGSKFWYQNGQMHRVDGPAIEWSDGTHDWYINNRNLTEVGWQATSSSQHGVCMTEAMTADASFELLGLECRVDGLGSLRYYNALGLLHRVYGPAVVCTDGYRAWFQNGQRHRIDGPAVEYEDEYRAWYINGKELTQDEWQKAVARWSLYD